MNGGGRKSRGSRGKGKEHRCCIQSRASTPDGLISQESLITDGLISQLGLFKDNETRETIQVSRRYHVLLSSARPRIHPTRLSGTSTLAQSHQLAPVVASRRCSQHVELRGRANAFMVNRQSNNTRPGICWVLLSGFGNWEAPSFVQSLEAGGSTLPLIEGFPASFHSV